MNENMYQMMEKIFQLKTLTKQGCGRFCLRPQRGVYLSGALSSMSIYIHHCICGLVFWWFCFALPLRVETQGLRWPVRRREGRSLGKELSSSRRLDPRVRGEEQVRAKRGRTGDSWEGESFNYSEQIHPWANTMLVPQFINSYNNWCVVKHLV